jgi:hypothetical protein
LGLQTSTRSVCLNFEGKNDDSSAFSTSINGHSSGFSAIFRLNCWFKGLVRMIGG